MSELVGESPLAALGRRRVLTGPESDFVTDGVRLGLHGLRRGVGRGVGVDAHTAEVRAERVLHGLAGGFVERPAAALSDNIEHR